jgi:hypothetical protein
MDTEKFDNEIITIIYLIVKKNLGKSLTHLQGLPAGVGKRR